MCDSSQPLKPVVDDLAAAAFCPAGAVAEGAVVGVAADVGVARPVGLGEGDAAVEATPDGVTAADCADQAELPFMLVALTWKRYGVPSVRPLNFTEVAVPADTSLFPGLAMTV